MVGGNKNRKKRKELVKNRDLTHEKYLFCSGGGKKESSVECGG